MLDVEAGERCRRVGVLGLQPGIAKKKQRGRGKAHACWLEGGAEKCLCRVNLLLRAVLRLAGTYANTEQVLGRADLGLFQETEPCRAAPA